MACFGIPWRFGLGVLVLGSWMLEISSLTEHELAFYLAGDGFLGLERVRMTFLRGHLNGDFELDGRCANCRSCYPVRDLHVEHIVPADYTTVKTRHESLVLWQSKWDD